MTASIFGDGTISVIHGIALMSMITLFHGVIMRVMAPMMSRGIAIGLVFGACAVFAMSDPLTLVPGVILDARGIILVMAGPFGGTLAALLAGAIAGVYRLYLGGAGAPIGLLVILAASAIGVVFAKWTTRRSAGYDTRQILILATAGSAQSLLLLLVPFFVESSDVSGIIIPHILMNWLGILLFSAFLNYEEQARHLTGRLARDATTDPLTGLANRRLLDCATREVFGRPGQHDVGAGFLLIDIDHFKRVNDRWGHSVGDDILIRVADAVSAEITRSDLAARFGGEEIAVLLYGVSLEQSLAVAECIRRRIDEDVFHISRHIGNVTVSIGIGWGPTRNAFATHFVAADTALYRAKASGRNRVEVAYSGPSGTQDVLRPDTEDRAVHEMRSDGVHAQSAMARYG